MDELTDSRKVILAMDVFRKECGKHARCGTCPLDIPAQDCVIARMNRHLSLVLEREKYGG